MTLAYPLPELQAEVAFIAYHFHWGLEEILSLPHLDRVAWVGQISSINKKIVNSDA